MDLTLVVLAAGLSTRFGRLKQLEAVGPCGEVLMDYAIYDAIRAGFSRVVLVVGRKRERAFREHVIHQFGDSVDVAYVTQEVTAVPAGAPAAPAGRVKPWGTAHAVLATADQIDGPFAVCNADDFYGAGSFQVLADYVRAGGLAQAYAVLGYTLDDTLSAAGGVSRGVCEMDTGGVLRKVIEVMDIRKREDGIAGVTEDGHPYPVAATQTVSTNFWAFTPAVFSELRRRFARFLERRGDDPNAEFLLPNALNEMIMARTARVVVLPANSEWLGVTFAADLEGVAARLRAWTKAGCYPEDFTRGSRSLGEG